MSDRQGLRLTFVVCLGVILSLSVGDMDDLSPQELGDGSDLAQVPQMPLAVVSSFTKKLEAQNKHLAIENTALRAQSEVDEGKLAATVVAEGGYPDAKRPDAEEEEIKKNMPPPEEEMEPEMKKGLKVMNEYQKKVGQLELKLRQETQKATAMKEGEALKSLEHKEEVLKVMQSQPKPADYNLIPFFKFDAGAKTVADIKDQKQCQGVCDATPKCLSYSWSTALSQCMWSVDTIHYDHLYSFSVKAQVATSGNPAAKWRDFPGVKYITAHSNNKENMEFDACRTHCADDAECKSFSYRQDTKFCSWSSNGMAYDAQFNYYEKETPRPDVKADAKKAKLKQQEEALKVKIETEHKREAEAAAEEAKENDQKQWEKNLWLKATPSTSDEKHLKSTVKTEMGAMDAKFATQAAAKKSESEKKAETDYEKAQLAAVTKMTKMESDLKKLQSEKKSEREKLPPLEEEASKAKVEVAKVKAKIKIADVDIRMKERAVESASTALKRAQKSGDAAALSTTTNLYAAAKKAVTEEEDKKSNFLVLLDEKNADFSKEDDLLKQAQKKEKEYKLEAKSKESNTKDAIKAEKKALAQQKLAMLTDKEKAFSAKVVAMKASEKLAKGRRAGAKVKLLEDDDAMKKITTDKERLAVESKKAEHNGELFKADKDNEDVALELVDAVKILAATKETLHKAGAAVHKAKESEKRENVDNKLQKLENEDTPSPV